MISLILESLILNDAFANTLPLQGSEIAIRWDSLYSFLLWLSVFFFVLVVGGMIYFMIAYRHRPGVKTKYITGNHTLEGVWIFVPTLLLMIIFAWGYSVYHQMTQTPPDAYEVRVIGKQWLWTFQYDNGRTTINELYVPMNRPIKLIMTSEDVLHSFFIPNFRVKQDVVPGMYSSVWFEPTVPGKHQVFCAEYCGTSHSQMLAQVIVLNDQQWNAWNLNKKIEGIPDATDPNVEEEPQQASGQAAFPNKPATTPMRAIAQVSLAEQGKSVSEQKGCVACHSSDGTQKIGPTFKGLFESKVELIDGKIEIADENFIRGHIENPSKLTVKGYSPVMPTFKGLISETEMNALLAYIKSLKQ
jgi:cytochrome c oxidase subunit II